MEDGTDPSQQTLLRKSRFRRKGNGKNKGGGTILTTLEKVEHGKELLEKMARASKRPQRLRVAELGPLLIRASAVWSLEELEAVVSHIAALEEG